MENAIEGFISTFLAVPGQGFLVYARKWWVYDDGYWMERGARLRLDQAIMNWGQSSADPEVQALVRRQYQRDLLARHLSQFLAVQEIPGRLNDRAATGFRRSSELQVPESLSGQDPSSGSRHDQQIPGSAAEDQAGTGG